MIVVNNLFKTFKIFLINFYYVYFYYLIQEDTEEINEVKAIIQQYCNKNISTKTANNFYRLTKENAAHKNKPLTLISKIAEYSTTQNIKKLNALFKKMLKDYEKPIEKSKQLKFNNFTPKEYDYDDLEKELLGWE